MKTLSVCSAQQNAPDKKKLSKWHRNTTRLLTVKNRRINQVFYKSLTIKWLPKERNSNFKIIYISCASKQNEKHVSGIESLSGFLWGERTTYRSWVSCWTSSCQCLLALSSALYIPLMCWITFFLSIPCDRDTACVMSPAILEMSLDFVSRRWKRLRKKSCVLKCQVHTLK